MGNGNGADERGGANTAGREGAEDGGVSRRGFVLEPGSPVSQHRGVRIAAWLSGPFGWGRVRACPAFGDKWKGVLK